MGSKITLRLEDRLIGPDVKAVYLRSIQQQVNISHGANKGGAHMIAHMCAANASLYSSLY